MCKDCGCSITSEDRHTHEHSHGDYTHTHEHNHHGEHNHSHSHSHPTLNEGSTIEVISKILDKNEKEAKHNQEHLDELGLFCINLMSSPGSGKTSLLEATIKKSGLKIGVIEGDLETNKDADRIINAGAKAHQITTGQACHLDAFMVHDGLHHLPLGELDLVFIENVGNLVCPASYELGSHLDVVLLSVPEGSDKIAKYPVMFRKADLVIITKISLLKHFDFSLNEVKKEIKKLNPKADVIALDSVSGEGVDKWLDYIKFKMELR